MKKIRMKIDDQGDIQLGWTAERFAMAIRVRAALWVVGMEGQPQFYLSL